MRREDPYFRNHRVEALIEDANFLLEQGEHIERVAKRLGISVSALEQTQFRKARRGE